LKQIVHVCSEHKKPKKLIKFLQKIRLPEKKDSTRLPALVIVFCNRIKTVLYVKDLICKTYPKCAALHGNMNQEVRDQVLDNFRAAKTHVLVATDIAARGLDIKHLPIVINWDMPSTIESYVHRVGRAARHSGDQGTAYTFYTRNFHKMAKSMIRLLKSNHQPIDPNLIILSNQSKELNQKMLNDRNGVDNNGEDEIESDAEPTDMPTSFGKNTNLALLSTKVYDDWSDSSGDDEEEEKTKKTAKDNNDLVNDEGRTVKEGSNSRPDSVPTGGKGSYRELCKSDFKRAAWLAGKASIKKTQEIIKTEKEKRGKNGGDVKDGEKKKKRGLKRPRGKRGGKKNKKGGSGVGSGSFAKKPRSDVKRREK